MVAALVGVVKKAVVQRHLLISLLRIACAAGFAIIFGFVLGCVLRPRQRLRRMLAPVFASYYAVPVVIFYPLLTLIVGYGSMPIIVIGFAMGAVAMTVATLEAMDRVPRVFPKVAATYNLGWWSTALRIRLPSAAPDLFTGIKVTIGYAIVSVIASEFLLSSEGIGHLIQDYYNDFKTRDMYGVILLVICLVLLINWGLRAAEERLRRHRALGVA